MFFNLAWRNSKRSRNENLIYFLTMVTAVAAFYIVLSLGAQDVIRFLSSLESDAVERLLTNLLPTVYVCALLFVFFLVVFANKYQLECRSRELGLYLMFGMTKTRLFTQIMTEGLITSARDKLQDELHALGLGADDYLTKPCNIERLLARIKNLLRRKEEQIRQGLLDGNGFLLDPNTFTIYVGKSSSLMPPNEGKILLALLKKSPNLVTKHELCNVLWGTEECIDENALQVTFTRLRKTLREFGLEERIETVRGQGYRLKEQVRL